MLGRSVRCARARLQSPAAPNCTKFLRVMGMPYITNFSPNCTRRGSPALVMAAGPSELIFGAGWPNAGGVVKLKDLGRDFRRGGSPVGEFFPIERSTFRSPGPNRMLRPEFPYVYCG